MSDLAIRVDNLGKRYYIGQSRNVGSLAESVGNFVARSFGRSGGEAHGPRTTYKPFWALRDVSFELKHGGSLGLIGRNGSGKSTLLKMLARITRPTEGSLEVRGRLRSLLEVGVGFHPELTGMENIYLSGSIMGMKRAHIRQKLDEIISFSGIEPFIETPVKYYSSGMYLRLAFSVSIHLEPDILLVDEVLAVGDLEFQKKCLNKLAEAREQGQTFILVSHAPNMIADMCSEAIWLERGRVADMGEARGVLSAYLRQQTSEAAAPQPGAEVGNVSETADGAGVSVSPPRPDIQREGMVIYDPPQGADGLRLLRAFIADEQGTPLPQVPYESPFWLVYEYRIDKRIPGMRLGLKLNDARQHTVVLAISSDSVEPDENHFGEPGDHRVSVGFPGSWFMPGRYSFELGLSSGAGVHYYQFDALSFAIVGPTFDTTGPEVIHPILAWRDHANE